MTSSHRKLLAAAALPLLAACGAGTSHVLDSGSAHGSTDQRALAALRQLARCNRAHGLPGFPDPVLRDDGVPVFPTSAPDVPPATQRACRTVVARIPPAYTETVPVSASDYQKLIALARCIRAHGIPDWPDPNPLGEFPIDSHIQQGGKRLFVPAVHACARLEPDPSEGINVVRARS
jgi:hypothetical protein